jgi:4-amino-4-deoxy-L-arabinose transferase-like glycosyltransferase
MRPPRMRVSVRPVSLAILAALAPLWLVGLFDRGLWTPDEPREADIAWRMSAQADRALPELAGTPFLEKPPLSYWAAGGAIALWGDSAAAARAPNLVYAAVTAVALGALALAMTGDGPCALLAAVIGASALGAYRVTIWLAPDAALLAGCAVALLGVWLGYRAPAGRAKALGYGLMHLGAAAAFMAKSAPGWLVPGLALLALIASEGRWRELRRWELYAGLSIQALVIGPWVIAVARSAHGADALRTLFWYNLAGRFMHVPAPAPLDYTSGHHNSPGKYLFELPLYLLPWTLLVAAALRRAWTQLRLTGPAGTPWRFALAASLPFLVLLSAAQTGRDVYAAPALLGFGLLAGLWAHEAALAPTRLDALALAATRWLVALMAAALIGLLAVLGAARAASASSCLIAALAAGIATAVALLRAAHAQRRGALTRSVAWTYGAYAAAVCLTALAALPVIDRWQDLPQLARRIHADTQSGALALLDPDETTIAMLDHGLDTRFAILTTGGHATAAAVSGWLASHGAHARVLVLLPGHAPGRVTQLLARILPHGATGDGVAGSLTAAGAASIVQRYELPQGRRYALLGPPFAAHY